MADAIASFRVAGSPFEGHPYQGLRGVEWCSGSLGQGLSVGCGLALAARMRGRSFRVFVVMGDGEQQKGQVMEAAEFAAKFRLDNLVAIVDANGLQATGRIVDVMPQDISARYRAAGWRVLDVDGHDVGQLYAALCPATDPAGVPTVVVARTTMGSGVSFIEDRFEYHGKVLEQDQLHEALGELGFDPSASSRTRVPRCDDAVAAADHREAIECRIEPGRPRTYAAGQSVDCRSAFGAALLDIVEANAGIEAGTPTRRSPWSTATSPPRCAPRPCGSPAPGASWSAASRSTTRRAWPRRFRAPGCSPSSSSSGSSASTRPTGSTV